MDFSRYGQPSAEWIEYAATHSIPPAGLLAGETAAQLRDRTNTGRESVSASSMKTSGLDQKVSIADLGVPVGAERMIPICLYRAKDVDPDALLPAYIFYHGGGFLFGTAASEDAACARIAAMAPIVVVSVCYRHTPEDRHSAQHDDAWAAFEWIADYSEKLRIDKGRLVVGGISAGGGLACSVAVRYAGQANDPSLRSTATTKAVIRGQVLCIPWLIHRDAYPFDKFASRENNSYTQCAEAPVLPMKQLNLFTDLLDCHTPNDPVLMSVGNMSDDVASRLAKTAFIVAGNDPVRDEGLMLATTLKAQSIPTKVHIFPGLPHGFRRFEHLSSSARWDQIVAESINWILSDDPGQEQWNIEGPPYES